MVIAGILLKKKRLVFWRGVIHEMDVRCDGNAISKSLPTGISLTSFHWAVSPSAPRQTSSNSKQLDKPGWEEIRLTTRFRWGLLIHLFWANTWFSGSEYRIVHIVSLFDLKKFQQTSKPRSWHRWVGCYTIVGRLRPTHGAHATTTFTATGS